MELDGYNEELKIAFEHQGSQHYEKSYYINNQNELNKRQKDDQIKAELCRKHGIKLITVPSIIILLPIENLKNYLIGKFCEYDIPENLYGRDNKIDVKKAYMSRRSDVILNEIKRIAKSKNGQLLSEEYVSAHKKLKFKCKEGHLWSASYANIRSGKWCPKCGRMIVERARRLPFETIKRIAELNNGKLISTTYINQNEKLEWECEFGHRFNQSYEKVKYRNRWCPICKKKCK
ncbi:MAG TPA: hypothetical protein PLM72_06775 [Spirochaetota bacterium]|nr:hypothetical protein [Spirochaetota bacterium]